MTPEGFARVQGAFEAALDLAPAERDGHVRRLLGDDEELCTLALDMLRGESSDPEFLRPPTPETVNGATRASPVLPAERCSASMKMLAASSWCPPNSAIKPPPVRSHNRQRISSSRAERT